MRSEDVGFRPGCWPVSPRRAGECRGVRHRFGTPDPIHLERSRHRAGWPGKAEGHQTGGRPAFRRSSGVQVGQAGGVVS